MIDKKDKKFIYISSIALILYLSLYLIAFFPGVITADSLSQWRQMTAFKFEDWHPVMHTLFNYLITRIWYSPASIVIAQILILTAVYMYGIISLKNIGVSKRILILSIAVFALYPANGFMIIALWKDVLYSIMLLLMTIILINIITTDSEWITKKSNIFLFCLSSFGVLFFRHNGLLVFVFVMFVLVIFYRKFFKFYFGIGISMLIIYFIITGPIYSLAGVEKTSSTEALGIPMQQIGAVISYNGNLNEEQKVFLNKILDLDIWKERYTYNPYVTDYVKFHEKFDREFLEQHKGEFIKNWIAIVKQNPTLTLKAYLKHTSIVWSIPQLKGAYTNKVNPAVDKNDFGLHQSIINNNITYLGKQLREFTGKNNLIQVIFWRPALWFYLSILSIAVIAIKYKAKSVVAIAPLFANVGSLMIAIPAQDYRYLYSNFLIAAIIIPWLIHCISLRKSKNY